MIQQAPAILVAAPLLAACSIAVAGWMRRALCFPLAAIALAAALWSAIALAARVLATGPFDYLMGGWPPPWGIAYRVDHLNAPVLVLVAGAALINLIASRRQIEEEQGPKAPAFYALYVLAVTGMMGIVVTGDAFNLYVLLEIASITGYALVALGGDRAPLASLNYVLLGTVGASFYLLGIGLLYMVTGSLNMMDMAGLLPALYDSRAVLAAFVLIMVGVWLKAALFPLHTWLPPAYTHAFPASSSLLAPLMTKVMIYTMLRIMLTLFTPAFVFQHLAVKDFIVGLAAAAILAGGLMALTQRDLRRMAAYIIVSEAGYMVGGAWLGNASGLTGAFLHLLGDALMTLCVFLAVNNVVYRVKSFAFDDLRGLFVKMPFTMAALVAAGLSIIGVPPACGFFSKWYLLQGAMQAGRYEFAAALLLSSLINVALFFRVFEIAFFKGQSTHGRANGLGLPAEPVFMEAPVSMVAPLLVTAGCLILMGLSTGAIVRYFIAPALAGGPV